MSAKSQDRHKALVKEILAHDAKAKTSGVRKFLSENTFECATAFAEIVPDAYSFHEDAGIFYCYEAVVTSEISDAKLKRYAMAWFIFECEEIDLKVIRVDRFGTTEIELGPYYYEFMQDALRNRAANSNATDGDTVAANDNGAP